MDIIDYQILKCLKENATNIDTRINLPTSAVIKRIKKLESSGVVAGYTTILDQSVLGWAYYGEVCAEFLTGGSQKAVKIYRILYVAFVFIGTVGSLDLIWSVSETMNGRCCCPGLPGRCFMRSA